MARGVLAYMLAILLLAAPVFAGPLPVRTGPVVLTVTGLAPATYPDGKAEFDIAMLQALGAAEITTTSIWTKGPHTFTGVPLRKLQDYLKIEAGTLSLHALNDYAVRMPSDAAEPDAPILAYKMDGQVMSVRDKGPIWVIYPYDAAPRYRTDTAFSRSIWQLDRIDVLR